MSNPYGLLDKDINKIRKRDKLCVYCHKKMNAPKIGKCRRNWATIEHLNHLPPWNNPNTVAICCGSCNSSRRDKGLLDWFKMPYCIDRNINHKTVANPVKEYIKKYEKRFL